MSIDVNWNDAWKAQQELRNNPDSAEHWDKRAPSFARECGSSPYAVTFIERAQVRKRETVFDMGCGSGAISIPLAREGHHVYACDFSQGMLDELMERAHAQGVADLVHPKLLAWDDDWGDIDIPVCDVAVASRSIATADMQAALTKLDAMARRRVCITLTTGLSPRADNVLLEVMGRKPPRYPDCVFAFNILWSMGIEPDVSYIRSPRSNSFDSFDAAIDTTSEIFEASSEERERLVAYSREHLHEVRNPEGATVWEYDHQRVTSWAFLAWNKDE